MRTCTWCCRPCAQAPGPTLLRLWPSIRYRLHEEAKKLQDNLLEGRALIWRQQDSAHASSLQLLRLDEQLRGLKAEREYLGRHGQLPPPGTPLYPTGAPPNVAA